MPTLLNALSSEIHVWFAEPTAITNPAIIKKCLSVLSESELVQYHRFRSDGDRHTYLVAHALVRYALSQYLDISPSSWTFDRASGGRPAISNDNVTSIHYNLTHTDGLTACVITREALCGIDAEKVQQRHNLVGVAKRMFSPTDFERMRKLTGRAQLEYFFVGWTLREAYVKALGTGISFPTDKLTFLVNSQNNIQIRFDKDIDDNPDRWRLYLLHPTNVHIGAVAVYVKDGGERELITREFGFDRLELSS